MLLSDFLKEEYENINLANIEVFRNKTLFITGGNGLIGSNIINYLDFINKKYNLNMKFIVHSFSKPVEWLPNENYIRYISSDLNKEDINFHFDYLIHTATYGQPKKFIENKLGTIELNTQTYIKLLEQSKRNNAKVLFMSSSEVYGQVPKEELPAKETYNGNVATLVDRAVYAESKRLAETISKVFIDSGLNIKIIRLAIAYGPGIKLNDTRFINEFIKRGLKNKEIKMLDKGLAQRHLGFITDMIEMILNVLISGKDTVYNIAGNSQKSIYEIAKIIADIEGIEVIVPDDETSIQGTPLNLILDTQKYIKEFNKTNFVSYEHGLKKTIEWIKYLNNKENI